MAAKKSTTSRLHPVDVQAGWRELSSGEFPPVWTPRKEGDELVGTVVRISQGQFGAIWRVRRHDDGMIVVLPNHVALIGRLEDAGVKPGWDIRVRCTSMGSRRKGDYYDYAIAVREPQSS
jgi:hypothetical protein